MFRALISACILFGLSGALPAQTPTAGPEEAAVAQSGSAYDAQAENELLDKANQARAKAGLAPLKPDQGLTDAARKHASAMAAQQQLSHQLDGEPSLKQRLADSSELHLDRAGENVAYSGSVDQAQDSLMHSPPHRQNLLHTGYNVAGFGVVHSGNLLYVVQDFGHSLPNYSPQESEHMIANSVTRLRSAMRLSGLQRTNTTAAEDTACAMAQQNSLKVPTPKGTAPVHYILKYTSLQPEILPANSENIVGDRKLHSFAVGTCYARTPTYPSGTYWVTLLFY